MKRMLALLLVISCLLLTGCGGGVTADPEAGEKEVRYLEAMDTFMSLTAYGQNRAAGLTAVQDEILRLDALLSTGKPDSEVSRLNLAGGATLGADCRQLVSRALALYDETGGCFDITVLPLMELWGFTSGEYRVPDAEELAAVLELVGADKLTYDADSGRLTLGEGQAIDLGGIAKGYTSQRAMELFRGAGVTSGMVSLGGNVQCLGKKPDGSPWRIGIQDPWGGEGAMSAVVEVEDRAVVTSGGYERFFVDPESGVNYHHILDPATGRPARSGLASVSIISPDGTLADGLSTALYIMGLERATAYWKKHSGEFQAIFIDDAGKLWVTEGLASSVTSTGAEMEVLRRAG